MRKSIIAGGAAALAVALTACGGGSGSSSSGGKDYVVGYVNGMSGALAVYGQYSLSYLQAAVKNANATGGVNGHKVDIQILDSAAVGQSAVSATQQMITKNKPDVIYGMTLSQDCAAAAPVAAKYKTPLVCATIPADIVSPVQPYVFGSQALEPALAKPAVDFAVNTLKLGSGTTYATFINNGAGDIEFAKSVDTLAPQAGFTKVAGQQAPLTAASVSTEVSSIVAKKPDVVFVETIGIHLAPLVQGLRAAGLKTPVIAIYSSLGYDGLIKLADPGFYQVVQSNYVTDQTASGAAGVAQVQKILTAGGLVGPTVQNQQLGASGILPPLGILQALKACGTSCTPAMAATSLQSVKVTLDGFANDYGWTAASHIPTNYVDVVSFDAATRSTKTDATNLPVPAVSGS